MRRGLGCEKDLATQATNYITGDAAFAVDRQGVIVLWNSEAEKLLGYKADAAIGQRCWNLLSGKDSYGNRYCCEFCPLREMTKRHESVHGFHLLLRTASNGRKKFQVSCLEIFDNPGNGLLLHICHTPDETLEYPENNHAAAHRPAKLQRHSLTNRECEVLALMAEGKTTREIASALCVSQATVRNHIQHTLDKLHVHNRLEAVLVGQRIDLI